MQTFVAKHNSQIIVFLTMLIIEYWDFRFASIEEIFIDIKYIGQGFGRKLVKKAIKLAKSNKVKEISIETDKENIIARKLYESVGFKDDSGEVINMRFKSLQLSNHNQNTPKETHTYKAGFFDKTNNVYLA